MELNAILYRNERALHRLHTRLAAIETRAGAGTGAGAGAGTGAGAGAGAGTGAGTAAEGAEATAAAAAAAAVAAASRYEAAAAARLRAMDSWLWSDASGCWHDLLWETGEQLPQVHLVVSKRAEHVRK